MLAGSNRRQNRKGDKFEQRGRAAEARQEWDDCAGTFTKRRWPPIPADPGYMLEVRKARFQAGQRHVDAGAEAARSRDSLKRRSPSSRRRSVRDPGSAIALQEWKRTTEMVEQEKNGKQTEGADRGMTPGRTGAQGDR